MSVRRTNPDDRHVVAEIDCALGVFEVVRYDNGAKWFIEEPSGERVIISRDEAVSLSSQLAHTVHPGVPGADPYYREVARRSPRTRPAATR